MIVRSGLVLFLQQYSFNITGPESVRLELLRESSRTRTHSHELIKVYLVLFRDRREYLLHGQYQVPPQLLIDHVIHHADEPDRKSVV
jgi:hypothetical protein